MSIFKPTRITRNSMPVKDSLSDRVSGIPDLGEELWDQLPAHAQHELRSGIMQELGDLSKNEKPLAENAAVMVAQATLAATALAVEAKRTVKLSRDVLAEARSEIVAQRKQNRVTLVMSLIAVALSGIFIITLGDWH